MSKIAVVYWSGTGNTESMANIILNSAKALGADASLFTSDEFSSVEGFDGIAFGCPSMGSEELEESSFEPMFSALESSLNGKKVALFGSYGWGDGEWMRNWEARTNATGANVVATVIANEAPDAETEDLCKDLAKKLAE